MEIYVGLVLTSYCRTECSDSFTLEDMKYVPRAFKNTIPIKSNMIIILLKIDLYFLHVIIVCSSIFKSYLNTSMVYYNKISIYSSVLVMYPKV